VEDKDHEEAVTEARGEDGKKDGKGTGTEGM
jgi:hypothetical protein